MRRSPPKVITFWISVALGLLGLLSSFGVLGTALAGFAFWLVFFGFALLAVSLMVEGLQDSSHLWRIINSSGREEFSFKIK